MKLVELTPAMFRDEDSFLAAVDFHNERAACDSEIKVVVYTRSEWNKRQANRAGREVWSLPE